MTRQSAPHRAASAAGDGRRHLELAKTRQALRHERILAELGPPPRQRGWSGFVGRHGWRAYALPLLVVLTLVALFTSRSGQVRTALGSHPVTTATKPGGTGTPPVAASTGQLSPDLPAQAGTNEVLPSDQLPPGPAYSAVGNGTYATIAGSTGVLGSGRLERFSIEVENGVVGIDLKQFAQTVTSALSDRRSWAGGHRVALQRVDHGPVNFHVTLTSSMTVRQLCGYDVPIETSCFAPEHDQRVVINDSRWVRGDPTYVADLPAYRIYMINHEVGHALGHAHAHECLASGLAPVMMQQTIGMKTASGRICQPNPWPYPPGNLDAPGAEQSGAADDAFIARNF